MRKAWKAGLIGMTALTAICFFTQASRLPMYITTGMILASCAAEFIWAARLHWRG